MKTEKPLALDKDEKSGTKGKDEKALAQDPSAPKGFGDRDIPLRARDPREAVRRAVDKLDGHLKSLSCASGIVCKRANTVHPALLIGGAFAAGGLVRRLLPNMSKSKAPVPRLGPMQSVLAPVLSQLTTVLASWGTAWFTARTKAEEVAKDEAKEAVKEEVELVAPSPD